MSFKERTLIPNDSKLFAQADTEPSIKYFLTSDSESLKAHAILQKHTNPHFVIIDLNQDHISVFGLLDLR